VIFRWAGVMGYRADPAHGPPPLGHWDHRRFVLGYTGMASLPGLIVRRFLGCDPRPANPARTRVNPGSGQQRCLSCGYPVTPAKLAVTHTGPVIPPARDGIWRMECLVVSIFTAPRCPCDPTERRDHHPPVSIFKASRCPWVMVRPILSRSSRRRDAPATLSQVAAVPCLDLHGAEMPLRRLPESTRDRGPLSRSSRRRDAPATQGVRLAAWAACRSFIQRWIALQMSQPQATQEMRVSPAALAALARGTVKRGSVPCAFATRSPCMIESERGLTMGYPSSGAFICARLPSARQPPRRARKARRPLRRGATTSRCAPR